MNLLTETTKNTVIYSKLALCIWTFFLNLKAKALKTKKYNKIAQVAPQKTPKSPREAQEAPERFMRI